MVRRRFHDDGRDPQSGVHTRHCVSVDGPGGHVNGCGYVVARVSGVRIDRIRVDHARFDDAIDGAGVSSGWNHGNTSRHVDSP
ncbi:MAG: hypothetical protein VX528_20370, partial [Candidatus Latescibacterota bacterium]|nr:hypothetical protein [Candidatus Latescibacterota bacterium]